MIEENLASFLADAALVVVVYLIAAAALISAYLHAGRIWLLRHGVISNNADGHRDVWPGEFGELLILTMALLAALIVMFFTHDTSLIGILTRWPLAAMGTLAFVAACVVWHSRQEVQRAIKAGHRRLYVKRLQRTYSIYNIYSICLFGMGAMIVMMLIGQFLFDGVQFANEASRITQEFELARQQAVGGTLEAQSVAMATAEQAYSRIALSGKALQNQFNPLFVFAGTLIMINITINMTSLKAMFTGGAVNMTAIFTYGPLMVIGAVGLLVYLNHYEVMLTQSLESLQAFTPAASLGDWELSKRHGEMVADLSNSRNIFGFATTVAGEGGGFAILAWGIQTALEKIGETNNPERVHLPLRKYRPQDGRYPWEFPREERLTRHRVALDARPIVVWRRVRHRWLNLWRPAARRQKIRDAIALLEARAQERRAILRGEIEPDA